MVFLLICTNEKLIYFPTKLIISTPTKFIKYVNISLIVQHSFVRVEVLVEKKMDFCLPVFFALWAMYTEENKCECCIQKLIKITLYWMESSLKKLHTCWVASSGNNREKQIHKMPRSKRNHFLKSMCHFDRNKNKKRSVNDMRDLIQVGPLDHTLSHS